MKKGFRQTWYKNLAKIFENLSDGSIEKGEV